jgi:hypothetical protein
MNSNSQNNKNYILKIYCITGGLSKEEAKCNYYHYLEIRGIKPIETKLTKKTSYPSRANLVQLPILPASYNYVSLKYESIVKNQGRCRKSWAFATAAMIVVTVNKRLQLSFKLRSCPLMHEPIFSL